MNNQTEQIFILDPSGSQQSVVTKLTETIVTQQDIEDFSTVCRTCATVTEFVIPIFDGEGLQNNLAEKIHKHLPIQVCETDVLPRVVCYQCASTLLAWHELVQCCVQADEALRTRLAVQAEQRATAEAEAECREALQDSDQDQQNKSPIRLSELKDILSKIFSTVSVNDETLDMELVCHKCEPHPIATTVKQLYGHLELAHSDISTDYSAVTEFVENFVVMQVTITEVPEWDMDSDSVEYPEVELQNFTCPFCKNIFSSITSLKKHLNEHVNISKENAVMCCAELYNTKKAFVGHIKKKHANPNLVGTQITSQKSRILKHHTSHVHKQETEIKKIKHRNQKKIPVNCPQCGKVLCNKYSMANHLRDSCTLRLNKNSTVFTSFGCPFCGSEFPKTKNLKIHLDRRHPEISDANPATCCDNTFTTRKAFYEHLRIHDNSFQVDPILSQFNEYIVPTRREESDTVTIHNEGTLTCLKDQKYIPATCAECGKILSNKYTLLVHLKTHHSHLWETSKNPEQKFYVKERRSLNNYHFFCPFCKSVFSHIARLLMHLSKHGDISKENGVKCCDETFTHKKLFADHLRKDHVGRASDEKINMFNICKTCGYETETLQALQDHISQSHKKQDIAQTDIKSNQKTKKRSSKKNSAVCPQCNKVFTTKSSMLFHLKAMHTDTRKRYACDKCDATRTSQSGLNVHKRQAHEGQLKHVCSFCGEGFHCKSARVVHERVHTGARPFRCGLCARAFRAKNTLDRHLDAHLDLRPHLCHLCPKKFRKISHLKCHLKTHKDA